MEVAAEVTANEKRIKARLEQIKDRAAQMNADQKKKSAAVTGADLAEEAAGLGLQLLEGKK